MARPVLTLSLIALLIQASSPAPNNHVEYIDVAAKAGLTTPNVCGGASFKRYTLEVTGNGCAFVDYDKDGALDIVLVNGSTMEGYAKGGDPLCQLYRNVGEGRFADVTGKAGLTTRGWGMGITVGDIDNDGWEDLYITGFGYNVLYRNNGNGTFTDITQKAGVKDGGWSTGAAFGDYDRDGFLDLFVVHYLRFNFKDPPDHGSKPYCYYRGIKVHCGPKGLPPERNTLYHNNGDGTFTDVSERAGISREYRDYGFTALWTDFDDDGWLDIFVANDSTPNIMYKNNGNGKFRDVALESGLAVSEDGREQAGMGADVGDFNGDGLLDFFVTNFSDDYYTLYRHERDHTYTDVSTVTGIGTVTWNILGWGTGFLDYNNDGLLDLFFSNGNIYPEVDEYAFGTRYREKNALLQNLGGEKFRDVSAQAGAGLQVEKSSRGAAFGDYDNDGDTDILIVNINDTPTLLENRGGNGKSWIGFLLEGTDSNRSGIGGRIRVRSGDRIWVGEVRSAASYISHNDRRIHFGLGGTEKVDAVEIRWPNQKIQSLGPLAARRYYFIKEGQPPAAISENRASPPVR